MRNPTKTEILRFKEACAVLNDLGKIGFHLYVANDNLHLMTGPSHTDNGEPQQHLSKSRVTITNFGGGDW